MRVNTFLLLLLLCGWNSYSQMDSVVVKERGKYEFAGVYRSSISVNGFGVAGIAGVSYEVLLSPHWSFEAGVGYNALGFGFDFYPWKIQRGKARMKFNTRTVYAYTFPEVAIGHTLGFGMMCFLRNKINFGFDAGIGYLHTASDWGPYDSDPADTIEPNLVGLSLGLKIGYRFSFRYMKRKRELERKKS